MENELRLETAAKIKALGIYQIAGGVIGLGLTAIAITRATDISALLLLILGLAGGLYCYSIYCGFLLMKKNFAGLNHSQVNQCLQLIGFSIIGITFQYTSGVFVVIGAQFTNGITLGAEAGLSSWKMAITNATGYLAFHFNLVAFCLILFIEVLKKTIRKEMMEMQLDTLGHASDSAQPE